MRLQHDWQRATAAALAVSALLIAVFWPTVSTMLHHWENVETYSHGFLILPISIWLVWRQRDLLVTLPHEPAPLAVFLVAGGGVSWLLASLLGIQVVEQLAFVGLWISALWAVIGHRLARQVMFPLLFLFTMVPMGDALVPPMMDFTADFTVWMLERTGIPVYREGLNFVIPSGNWSVVEACSGIRYLIASITLGLLYAHLSYRSLWRQAVFVLLSALVPILANGLRAYMIVMIGHVSDMELAVGVDHLIYGWIFFGLVMLLLFWVGSFFMDMSDDKQGQAAKTRSTALGIMPALMVALGVVAVSLAVRGIHAELSSSPQSPEQAFVMPSAASGWALKDSELDWPAAIPSADQVVHAVYEKQGRSVILKLGLFHHQRQGHEVVSSNNKLLAKDEESWRVVGRTRLEFNDESRTGYLLAKQQGGLVGASVRQLLATSWYRLGQNETRNGYLAKFYEAVNLVTKGRNDGVYIAMATDQEGGDGEILQSFAQEVLPAVWASWDRYLEDVVLRD